MTSNQDAVSMVSLAVIAAGTALAFAAAVIPYFEAGYHLAGSVLFVGVLPFVAYGALLRVLRPGAAVVCGLVLLAANAAIMIPQRFAHFDGYGDGWIYAAPLLTTFVVLPVFLIVGRRRQAPARGAEDSL